MLLLRFLLITAGPVRNYMINCFNDVFSSFVRGGGGGGDLSFFHFLLLRRFLVARQDTPLPNGWTKEVDGKGRTFYKDHISKKTQWDRPVCGSEASANRGAVSNRIATTVRASQRQASTANNKSGGNEGS